jgi:signal peptidase I
MTRKTRRRLLSRLSRVPGLYSLLAFVLARRVLVRGWSMAPTLLPGERLLFDRLAYVRARPRRGDILLVSHPLRPGLRMVKRLSALPGDPVADTVLGAGDYWVTGDAGDMSTDSREFGPVKRDDLLGRAWIRYWPIDAWRVFD